MRIKELIEELKKFDEELYIESKDADGYNAEIKHVKRINNSTVLIQISEKQ